MCVVSIYIRCSTLHSEPPKTKYEGVETCGGKSKAPDRGWKPGFQGRGPRRRHHPPAPCSPRPCRTPKKMAGSKERWIGPMKRTAKHGVGSPNAACTKSTVREKPVYSRKKSASSRSEPAISEPAPRWHAGDSVRDPRCRRVLRATGNYRHECHMPDTTNTAIDTIQRVIDDTANQPTHAPHTRT